MGIAADRPIADWTKENKREQEMVGIVFPYLHGTASPLQAAKMICAGGQKTHGGFKNGRVEIFGC